MEQKKNKKNFNERRKTAQRICMQNKRKVIRYKVTIYEVTLQIQKNKKFLSVSQETEQRTVKTEKEN